MGLFSFKKRQPVVQEPSPALTAPVAQSIGESDDFGGALAEYEAVAMAVGFQNPAVVLASLNAFLRKNQILFYPYRDVAKFLTETAERVGKNWGWRPLRPCDGRLLRRHWNRTGDDHNGRWANQNGYFFTAPYLDAVPLPALAKVQTIIQGFAHQDQLAFGVSNYEVPRPDPFLCVVCPPGNQVLVIDHWDEPGFRAST